MIPPIDPDSLPGPAKKIASGQAPPKLQLMAAKGVVPGLKPDALITVLVHLADAGEPEVAEQARATLAELPEPVLTGALDADLPEAVIMALAERYIDELPVLEKLIGMPRLPIEAVEHLAEHGGEDCVELVATHEERMLENPQLIASIYLNQRARMSTANRLVELAVRNGVEVEGISAWKEISQAIQGELVPEKSDEPLPEDELFWEQSQLAEQLTDERAADAFEEDDEGEEYLKDRLKPLYQRMADMTHSEKIRRAMVGTKEERLMLLREQNKMVASAAARSPLLQEPEVAQISQHRGVVDDVLRIIGTSPEWLKSYQVKKNLVENPKTPIAIAAKLVVQLRESDLRKISRSKNVSGAVQAAAKRHLARRKR